MRILRINGQDADLDDATAIGLTFQAYDVKNPSLNKVTVSNSFTLPRTQRNETIIGFGASPQNLGTTMYEYMSVEYWIDNEKLLNSARLRVDEVGDRINCFVFQKATVWDTLKNTDWSEFMEGLIDWLIDVKGFPSAEAPKPGDITGIINDYADGDEGVKLAWFRANLTKSVLPAPEIGFVEGRLLKEIVLHYQYVEEGETVTREGGHWSLMLKTVFEYIEYAYDVDLKVSETFAGNVFNDTFILESYVHAPEIGIRRGDTGSYFTRYDSENTNYDPYTFAPREGKKVMDFVNAFFMQFNCLVQLQQDESYKIQRFDDIEAFAPNVDFSKNITGKPVFAPKIEGYGQETLIKYKTVYEGGNEVARTLTCQNLNVEASKTLFSIDAYLPYLSYETIAQVSTVLNLSEAEALKQFTFLHDGEETIFDSAITIRYVQTTSSGSTTALLPRAAVLSLESEYLLLDKMITRPVTWKIKKWLTITDIINLDFFKKYYVNSLGASFFINKISGFNPNRSKSPTTIELIKIDDSVVLPVSPRSYWLDGEGVIFGDAEGGRFYFTT